MVTINIGRKEMIFFSVVILVFVVAGLAIAQWDSTKTMFHDADNVKVTLDGVDYSLQELVASGSLGGGMKFGSWADVTSVASSGDEVASADGIIIAYSIGSNEDIKSYTPASVLKQFDASYTAIRGATIFMPVRKGDTWKVTGATEVYWIPIISVGGSFGGLSCHTVTSSSTDKQIDVYCDSGERTGGGCYYDFTWFYGNNWYNAPIDNNGWRCNSGEQSSRTTTAYVVCCE